MKRLLTLLFPFLLATCAPPPEDVATPNSPMIRGWNILSNEVPYGLRAIDKADEYGINHLQLSHHLIMDLKDVRDAERLASTRELVDEAHNAGIEKVLVWDHALYEMEYYPDRFKNKDGLINLDDPNFWQWIKADYRSMLDSLTAIDGIILTFIETGAHVEDQYSERWQTPAEKLANMVDSVASVIIDERGLELYIRTFIYHREELEALLGCVNLVRHPEVKIMTKEVPHDFFLTHPVSDFVNQFDKDVIMEFDLGHEYHGQGVIASILPEITVERWKYYSQLDNVIGYVARSDRYGTTQNVGRATEVNLYALKRITEDTSLTAQVIVEDFISQKYGSEAVETLLPVFLETDDITLSIYYTLGLHMNRHSRFEFDYASIYSRHCSGKWLEHPVVRPGHGVDKEMHYWRDVVEHLAPPRHKAKLRDNGQPTTLYREVPWVIDSGWVTTEDRMNEAYLMDILTEKEYGVTKAQWALEQVKKAESMILDRAAYQELLQLYERTYLTARLYQAGAKAYFGYRTRLNEEENAVALVTAREGIAEIERVCEEIRAYPHPGPVGQFSWLDDTNRALAMVENITKGWDVYGGRKLE